MSKKNKPTRWGILKFDLGDEEAKEYFKMAKQSGDLYYQLIEFERWLRNKGKYSDFKHKETDAAVREIREVFYSHMGEFFNG